MTDSDRVSHNERERRFEITIEGQHAVADYRPQGDDMLVFHHTFVPTALRGRKIAQELVEAGLTYAREHGKKVVPQCSYVASYIARHPEHQSLLADGS